MSMLWTTADAWIAHADGFYSYRIDPGSGGSYSPQRITRNGFATAPPAHRWMQPKLRASSIIKLNLIRRLETPGMVMIA